MFDEMVSLLKQGEMVQPDLLRKRFDRALVKKMGVIRTPYSFWSSDPKINPLAKELLWATILLEDSDNFMLLKGILATELDEKKRASGQSMDTDLYGAKNYLITDELIQELLNLAPSEDFRALLEEKIKNTAG